jgi:hypothetical protein
MKIQLTLHAEEQIHSRKLTRERVIEVVSNPEQVVPALGNRYFVQSRYEEGGKQFLLRVLVEEINGERRVLTVYPTSKVRKYWLEGER